MYLLQTRRHDLDARAIEPVSELDLAYEITKLLLNHWEMRPTFATLTAIKGTIDEVVHEFDRRIAIPFREQRRATYGDTYNGADEEVPF